MALGPETEQIEYKKSTGELKEGIVSVASMLNKHGSCELYFGVKNDGGIIGQQIGDSTLRDISQAINTSIKPQIIPTISLILMDDKNVIKVTATGNEKPYSAYGKYYMRSADEDREITPAQLRNLMLADTVKSITAIKAENQALIFNQLQSLYITKGMSVNPDAFAKNTGLLTSDGSYNLMAEILADNNPYSIKVARFDGTDKSKLIMRNEYGYKCMLLAMQQASDYMDAINETWVDLSSDPERSEQSTFDADCFREAWGNACLHNQWSSQVSPAIYIYDDRIEVVSTGGLPADYSTDEFFLGVSHPVNIGLQKIMGQLNFAEQTGHGVPLIVKKYGREAFTITEHSIIVTIPLNKKKTAVDHPASLSKAQAAVLDLIRHDSSITVAILAQKMQLSDSRINQILRQLRENGLLKREGGKRAGKWIIIE